MRFVILLINEYDDDDDDDSFSVLDKLTYFISIIF